MNVLLIGYGDLAGRLAPRLRQSGWRPSALCRSAGRTGGVDGPDTPAFIGDARDVGLLDRALAGQDAVVVTLTPDARTESAYRDSYVGGARALAAALAKGRHAPRLVVWVSSTRVYGDGNGDWVDEDTPATPGGWAGRCLLDAETVVRELPVPTVVVRFSGIYGPGRTRLIDQVRAGQCAPSAPVQWTNRIHSDDCAGVLHHVLGRFDTGRSVAPLYIGSDSAPVALHELQRWLADRLGVACTTETAAPPSVGRRCRNDRLLASGYRFLYPSWRHGYGALLDLTS